MKIPIENSKLSNLTSRTVKDLSGTSLMLLYWLSAATIPGNGIVSPETRQTNCFNSEHDSKNISLIVFTFEWILISDLLPD